MKIVIMGNSGSGKSTLARYVATECGLPLLDLDTVAWQPGKVAVPRDSVLAQQDVDSFCQRSAGWVVEGCYADLVAVTLPYDPLLLFLDPGTEVCLRNCQSRPWESHKYASPLAQNEMLPLLLAWVAAYETREGPLSLRGHVALYEGYVGRKQRLREQRPASEILRGMLAFGA